MMNAVEVAYVWVVVVEIRRMGAVEVPVRARVALGDEEPMPRLPDWVRMRKVEVALFADVVDATMKSGVPAGMRLDPATDRMPQGVEVPIPSLPFVVSNLRKFAESSVVAPE